MLVEAHSQCTDQGCTSSWSVHSIASYQYTLKDNLGIGVFEVYSISEMSPKTTKRANIGKHIDTSLLKLLKQKLIEICDKKNKLPRILTLETKVHEFIQMNKSIIYYYNS